MTEQLMSIRMFAERLAISEVQARRLVTRKVIGSVKLGRLLRVRAGDVESLVRNGIGPQTQMTDKTK